ncbi:MAG: hypothetical protein Q8K64_12405 [Sediminibacterium sp.]|nr:hypothetical protein [Sediminibacterium sp.]
MTGLEVKIMSVAKIAASKLTQWGFEKIVKNENNLYIQELYEVIVSVIKKYDKLFPITEIDRIPFYNSQTLLEEFLQFRFTKQFDKEKVRQKLEENKSIIPPSPNDINRFYELFDAEIKQSTKLSILNIDVNYKEEVFNISETLRSFRDEVLENMKQIRYDISTTNVSAQLMEEWNKQLDEIVNDLKCFKAKTANQRLESLEERIKNQGIEIPRLFGRLYRLQADAHDLFYGMDVKDDQAKLLIKVYSLLPTNIENKANAALSYFSLNNYEKAVILADQILAQDEYNILAWTIKCFAANDAIFSILPTVPTTVRDKNLFKVNLYRWLLYKKMLGTIEDIEGFTLTLDIDYSKIPEITYRNLHYQHLVAVLLLNSFFARNKMLTPALFYPEAKEDKDFVYAYKILEACARILKATEIEEGYRYYEFQYHCCRYILREERQDLLDMERIFQLMEEYHKEPDVFIRMMQAFTTLDGNANFEKAIAVGLQGPKTELFSLLIAGTYAVLGNRDRQTEYFIEYLRFQKLVDGNVFFNFIHFVRVNGISLKETYLDEIVSFANNTPYESNTYRLIFNIFIYLVLKRGDYTSRQVAEMINQARDLVDPKNERISIHIAFALVMTERLIEAKSYIEQFLDTNHFSETYILYCKILFQTQGEKVKLLVLLRKHREQFEINKQLLEMEQELVQLQGNLRDAAKIAKKGTELFPESEFFISRLFYCLNAIVQIDEIKKIAPLAAVFHFTDEQLVISIANVFIRAELFQETLDLLYRYAIDKSNIQVRQAYLALSHHYPDNLMKQFEEVDVETFVKYEVNREIKFLSISNENKEKHPYSLFVGKKTGETFSVKRSFSTSLEMVKVVRIMDKYLTLFEEILQDTKDPLSSMSFRSFELKGDSIEEINASFQEEFGTEGSLEKERIQAEYEKYYNGQICFGEIAKDVFHKNLVDAYFLLTHNNGKPFKALSSAIGPLIVPDDAKCILDVTSLCLFHLLEMECGFIFPAVFIASPFLRQHLVEELEQTKVSEYKLSLSVTMESVTPHFYDDQFKNRRLETFQGLINWLDTHCEVVDIPERLNLITEVKGELQKDTYFNLYLDNRLLIDRVSHILLTDDIMYLKFFGARREIAISPISFLRRFYPDKQKEYSNFLLSKNYVGIHITSSILKDDYFKMLSGQPNKFSICLENLRFNWNPDPRHIQEVIVFIKDLYVSSFITDASRIQCIGAVLQNLVIGMDSRLIKIIEIRIEREFRLLGIHGAEVLMMLRQITGR